MASDGKWYDPSTHPDPNYRASLANTDVAVVDVPIEAEVELEVEESDSDVVLDLTESTADLSETKEITTEVDEAEPNESELVEGASDEMSKAPQPESRPGSINAAPVEAPEREKVSTASPGATGWIADTSAEQAHVGFADVEETETLTTEERVEAIQAREMEERRVRLERARRSAEALRDRMVPVPEDETEEQIEESDLTPEPAHMATQVTGRTKLEINDGAANGPDGHTPLHFASPPTATTTALVHVPGADKPEIDPIDRLLAVLLFMCGIGMVIGAFMEWTNGPTTEIGWERPDGIVVVVAGAIAAAAAGPLYGGLYAAWARGVGITAGVVGLMSVGVVTVTTLTQMELTGKTIAAGVYVVGAATLGAIVASLASSKHSH